MSIPIPRIDTVMHFTDEIGVVEISTFRDELILVIAEPWTNVLTTHHEGQTIITIRKEPCTWCAGDLTEGEHGENICGGWLRKENS